MSNSEHDHFDVPRSPAHIPRDADGNCIVCHQAIKERKEPGPMRARRPSIKLTPPPGEEGVLEDLIMQLVEKYDPLWPDHFAQPGERFWLWKGVHFAVYAVVTLDIVPSEEGG